MDNELNESAFERLNLRHSLASHLDDLGFQQMTAIQQRALPVAISGKDVVAKAETGSGKTLAFSLGLIDRIQADTFRIQGLILCPTRELATQVANEIKKFARPIPNVKILTLCGGSPIASQLASLEHGAHIVVGTPGRILDHLGRKSLALSHVQTLVLDEADRMLEMGFGEDIRAVAAHLPKGRQTLLFSATLPENIMNISADLQTDATRIDVEPSRSEANIEQAVFEVHRDRKLEATAELLSVHQPRSCLIFCATKVQCDELAEFLRSRRMSAASLHGGFDQYEREEVFAKFANESLRILVATDVAARGLDVKGLPMVLSYELPKDPKIHIHRVGRTGRAGAKGLALSLCAPNEVLRLKGLEAEYRRILPKKKFVFSSPKSVDPVSAPMTTLRILGGKRNKLRPGDILGALTKDAGLDGGTIGKIHIFDSISYVGVTRGQQTRLQQKLRGLKVKNRTFRMKLI